MNSYHSEALTEVFMLENYMEHEGIQNRSLDPKHDRTLFH